MQKELDSAAGMGQDFLAQPAIPSQPGPNSPGPVHQITLGSFCG